MYYRNVSHSNQFHHLTGNKGLATRRCMFDMSVPGKAKWGIPEYNANSCGNQSAPDIEALSKVSL